MLVNRFMIKSKAFTLFYFLKLGGRSVRHMRTWIDKLKATKYRWKRHANEAPQRRLVNVTHDNKFTILQGSWKSIRVRSLIYFVLVLLKCAVYSGFHKNIRQLVNSDKTTGREETTKKELLSGGGSLVTAGVVCSGQFDFGRGWAWVISGTGNV